jgi:hypothetical protein
VRALHLASQELQADVGGPKLFGRRRQLDTAAEPLVLVHDDRDRGPGRADLPSQVLCVTRHEHVASLIVSTARTVILRLPTTTS